MAPNTKTSSTEDADGVVRIRRGIEMDRKKEGKMKFNIYDRGFNVRAWYLRDTEKSKGDALIEIRYKNKLIRRFLFPAYKIYNIAAHFKDIVDGELSKNNKDFGYRIAASTGLGI